MDQDQIISDKIADIAFKEKAGVIFLSFSDLTCLAECNCTLLRLVTFSLVGFLLLLLICLSNTEMCALFNLDTRSEVDFLKSDRHAK